jgi:thymidylate synthase ThyX
MEPYMWHEVVITATEWSNFFNLRISPHAQPEFCYIAKLMKAALDGSIPMRLKAGEWHLPWANRKDEGEVKISSARCARVSYLTHAGTVDTEADLALHDSLLKNGHMSPFDHPAQCTGDDKLYGRFRGWKPYRKSIPGEDDMLTFRRKK